MEPPWRGESGAGANEEEDEGMTMADNLDPHDREVKIPLQRGHRTGTAERGGDPDGAPSPCVQCTPSVAVPG